MHLYPAPPCVRRRCAVAQVHTIDRWSREQRVVGYAALNVFIDPKQQLQPLSKNVRDYVLNQVSVCPWVLWGTEGA